MMKPFTVVYVWRQSRLGVSEGLNVLLTDLIRGLMECRIPVRLLTTGRHMAGLHDMLEKNNISVSMVEVVKITQGSFVLALKDRWLDARRRERRPVRGLLRRLKKAARQYADYFFGWLFDLSLINFPLKLVIGFVVFVIALIAFPWALMATLMLPVARKILYQFAIPAWSRIIPRLAILMNLMRSAAVWERVYHAESQRFGRAVDRAPHIDGVFIPTAYEGHICTAVVRKPKMIAFPDVTPLMFPTRFPGSEFADLLLASMRESVQHADGIVCYSEFARDQQLRQYFFEACKTKPIEVIPQGFFVEDDFGDQQNFSDSELRRYIKNYFPDYGALPDVYFSEFSLIIYPTVDRPHKNTLTLVRAFEALLRERGRNIKLVLTSPGGIEDTLSFIRERKLHRDVLFMPALPIKVLNHLLERAAVMVHPSLAEGGDIFNFSRAVSHGTPALIADIPVAREMFVRNGFDESVFCEWLFKPTDHTALAEKIDRILLELWQPLAAQQGTLEALSSYRFFNMASRYSDFFQRLVSQRGGC